MNAREWKPGDVAMVSDPVHGERVMVHVGHDPAHRCWHGSVENGDLRCLDSGQELDARPLVVIDPEDREQVERLWELYRDTADDDARDGMQAALREFANPTPPKPPADVAARVTDRRDNIWRLLADGEWVCVDGPDHGEYVEWDRLASERGPLEVQP